MQIDDPRKSSELQRVAGMGEEMVVVEEEEEEESGWLAGWPLFCRLCH